MTTLVTASQPRAVLPVPWRRLSWVAWRRYRPALAATGALMGIVALYLLVRGQQMRSAYDTAQACTPQSGAACRFAWNRFDDTYANIGFAGGILVFIPAVFGAFAGAPLLARELETGTFRYAWTQGAGRMRWLLALLVPGTLGVGVVAAAFGALITWYEHPLIRYGDLQRLHPSVFPITGVAVVGWAVLAYAVGVLAGLLTRRVAPALAATLAVWTGLAFLTSDLRKHHYQAPLATANPLLPIGDQQVGQWWTHGGVRVSDSQINQVLQSIGVQTSNAGGSIAAKPGGAPDDPFQYLIQHGYTQWTSYQPDTRYWTFQTIEFTWLAVLSLLLLLTTVWLVRRRGA